MNETSTAKGTNAKGRQEDSAVRDPASQGGKVREAQLRWDDQRMATTFANVVNIQGTREQVCLFFGTNQTWNAANEKMLSIELSNRIILSPFATKRLSVALNSVLREYEQRYGQLEVEGG